MLMPAELPLHDRQSNRMIVYIENHEILVAPRNRGGFALQINNRQSRKCSLLSVSDDVVISLGSVISHGV